jgi:hypothetical protein
VRRRRSKDQEQKTPPSDPPTTKEEPAQAPPRVTERQLPPAAKRPQQPVQLSSDLQRRLRENTQRWCQRVVRDKGVEGLRDEFIALKRPVDPSTGVIFMQQAVGTRNRYKDVICLDKSRVVLKNAENDCEPIVFY